jgi:anti-sigma B factor antagonist
MRLKESNDRNVAIFTLEGEIDLHYAPGLRALFQAKAKARTPALVVDLTDVPYIDSTGLAAIIEYFRDSCSYSGIFCLAGLNEQLKSIFKIVRLDKAIPMFETAREAVDAIVNGAIQPASPSLFTRPAA